MATRCWINILQMKWKQWVIKPRFRTLTALNGKTLSFIILTAVFIWLYQIIGFLLLPLPMALNAEKLFFLFNNFLNSYQQTKMYRMANTRSAQKDNHVSKKAIFFAQTRSFTRFNTSAHSVALSNWMKFNTFYYDINTPFHRTSVYINIKIISWYVVFIHPFADSLSFALFMVVSYFMDVEIVLR